MTSMAEHTRALWLDALPERFAALDANRTADVVVVGAGIVGLTTTYLLARTGRSVIVLDDGPPGGGMTGRTTAHLSCALDDRWVELVKLRGEDDARLAAQSHMAAIDIIERIQQQEGIACDFARVPGCLVAATTGDQTLLRDEHATARKLGIDCTLGAARVFPHRPESICLTFHRQGRFHPLKYLGGLLGCATRDGAECFEAHVVEVEEKRRPVVKTDKGWSIEARAVVIATNTPINDRVTIHTKQAPYRSYVVAGRVPANAVPDVLCWDTADPYHYARLQPLDDSEAILIVGGEDHKTGQASDMDARIAALQTWMRAHYPVPIKLTDVWSGQVMESIDYLAFAGRNPDSKCEVYVATGDSGMGMTHGTIAAQIIADLIRGDANPWIALYDPARRTLKAAGTYIAENTNVAAQFADHVTAGDVQTAERVAPGTGALVRRGLHKVAVYRNHSGSLTELSAVCPHMGCIVQWNAFERCWDCPCHGSQFAPDGTVLNGPATSPLAAAEKTAAAE